MTRKGSLMSTRRRRHDYDDDDYDYDRRSSRHRRSHTRGMGLGAWVLIIGTIFIWAKYANTGTPEVTHSPSHGSTVCTQYFKGGC
jgi:hypothetical protein